MCRKHFPGRPFQAAVVLLLLIAIILYITNTKELPVSATQSTSETPAAEKNVSEESDTSEEFPSVTGWEHIDGETYYFGENGVPLKGWQNMDGKTYLFASDTGALVRSNFWLDGIYYWIQQNGSVVHPSVYAQKFDEADRSEEVTFFGDYTPDSKVVSMLRSSVEELRERGYQVGFLMMDLNTGQGVACNPDMMDNARSTLKGTCVASLVSARPEVISSWEDTMRIAVQISDNDAYASLFHTFGTEYMEGFCSSVGVRPDLFSQKYPDITVRELAKLWVANYAFFDGDINGTYAGAWYEEPNLSAIHSVLGEYYLTRSKAGWYYTPYHNANDAGIVYAGDNPYLIAIMSSLPGEFESLENIVWAIEVAHQDMIHE